MGRGDRALSASEDERYLVAGGRRWRRQDPELPEDRRARWERALHDLRALDAP